MVGKAIEWSTLKVEQGLSFPITINTDITAIKLKKWQHNLKERKRAPAKRTRTKMLDPITKEHPWRLLIKS